MFDNKKIAVNADILIGRNGATKYKQEGDGKTPIGIFELGIAFGTHDRSEINIHKSIEYVKINPNLYWVDDVKSKYYNKLVDVSKVEKAWNSAEHLIDYPIHYEYAIEIKSNPQNVPGEGSAIFMHCSNEKETAGCVAVSKEKMISLLEKINRNTKVIIEL
ncbi:MAG: L,D-transpeptidase family protein [Clostridia bacterium]|nr:L,D-transpeptidase family protein [Clostridia bacterium]